MNIVNKISVDLARRGIMPKIDAVQGDANTREIEISLYSGGAEFTGLGVLSGALAYRKPDKTSGLYDKLPNGDDAVNIDGHGNTVTVTLAPQVLTVAGRVMAALVLNDADLNQIATFPFIIEVAPNPAAGKTVSNDYYKYSTLADLNAAMEALEAQEAAAIDDAAIGAAAWSSMETVERLCPAVSGSGTLVVLEDVLEDFPLEITAAEGTLHRCGKNLLDVHTAGFVRSWTNTSTNHSAQITETGVRMTSAVDAAGNSARCGFVFGRLSEFVGKTVTVSAKYATSLTGEKAVPLMMFVKTSAQKDYLAPSSANSLKSVVDQETCTVTIEADDAQMPYLGAVFYYGNIPDVTAGDWTEYSDIQIEVGAAATAYEACSAESFAVGDPVPALPGTNVLRLEDGGELTAAGRADPKRLLANMNTRLQALEAALVNG